MTRYAESSAVLAWLLGETRGRAIEDWLAGADAIVTSDLTLVEIDRALLRLVAVGRLDEPTAAALRERTGQLASTWAIEPVSTAVVERARQSFPHDLIRALDAIHVATAVVVQSRVVELDVLSLDDRVRSNAAALGLRVVPD